MMISVKYVGRSCIVLEPQTGQGQTRKKPLIIIGKKSIPPDERDG